MNMVNNPEKFPDVKCDMSFDKENEGNFENVSRQRPGG